MAVHMAIDSSFLAVVHGYTLGTSIDDIAALLISLYPVFPSSPDDNRYHSQAMRHLYVLAPRPLSP